MHPLWRKLSGGDRRSLGRSEEVVADIRADPALFKVVWEGMWAGDALISMRCADVVEKITREHPDHLRPHKAELLKRAAQVEQQEVRWHTAQLFSRLRLTARERRRVVEVLNDYLNDQSSIVKTFAMQALAEVAEQEAELRPALLRKLKQLSRTGTPAIQSRGRRLLQKLKRFK